MSPLNCLTSAALIMQVLEGKPCNLQRKNKIQITSPSAMGWKIQLDEPMFCFFKYAENGEQMTQFRGIEIKVL